MLSGFPEAMFAELEKHVAKEDYNLSELFEDLSDLCCQSERKIVLVIDEVDSASNNDVFLDFVKMRAKGVIYENT